MNHISSRRKMLKFSGTAALVAIGLSKINANSLFSSNNQYESANLLNQSKTKKSKGAEYPPLWKKGDTGYVCTPCSNAELNPAYKNLSTLERQNEIAQLVESFGLKPVISKNFDLAKSEWGKESIELRLKDLNAGVSNQLIWSARGAGMALSLLDGIDYESFAKYKPLVLGYSGMTPVINAITAQTNLITFHGPMATQVVDTTKAKIDNAKELSQREIDLIFKAINGQPVDLNPIGDEVHIFSFKPVNLKVERFNCPDKAEGIVIAGHFQGFWQLAGTKWALCPDRKTPKLLFLESMHVDQEYNLLAMEKMRTLGYFENAVFCTGITYSESTVEFLRKYSDEFNLPVISGLRYGHLIPSTVIPVGAYATLDIKNLIFHAPR